MSDLQPPLPEVVAALAEELSAKFTKTVNDLLMDVWGDGGMGYSDREKFRAVKRIAKVGFIRSSFEGAASAGGHAREGEGGDATVVNFCIFF